MQRDRPREIASIPFVTASSAARFLLYLAVFAALCVASQLYRGAYIGDLSRSSDESAHFVNSAMIRDYVLHGLGTNPIRFALAYYGHFPKVSIGHWPPFFHIVQAGIFLFTGASLAAAIGIQAVIAASVAALTAMLVDRRAGGGQRGMMIGAAAGLAVLISPDMLRQTNAVMLDTFLSLLVLLSCLAWATYARTDRTVWSMAFALCGSAAILTKGNAFGLGLLPILYVALSGRTDLLTKWRTWLSAFHRPGTDRTLYPYCATALRHPDNFRPAWNRLNF